MIILFHSGKTYNKPFLLSDKITTFAPRILKLSKNMDDYHADENNL